MSIVTGRRCPDDPFGSYGRWTAYGVGMLHGVGAETATQVLIFLAAAQAGGAAAGVVVLGAFVVGLVVANTAIAVVSTMGYLGVGRSFPVYAAVAVLTGGFSLAMGTLLLAGRGGALPAILSG